ncbi:GNAT family N-acetyltransferase [Paenibacillus flagellatus]|uniref:GNAT family N-acetyltransferase n=1 Tax=Paenibacillus flagellatus TaxID=2211139 RepID=UPI001305157B|nr:GNAT family N-acetyltransferase [Paenibacillus flagellatus]
MLTAGENLRLRPIRLPDDIAAAVPWYQDPEVLFYSEGGELADPYDAARIETMYQYLTERAEVYMIEVLEENGWIPIGDVSLFHDCGVPIVIGNPAYRSRGIGKRVMRRVVERAKELGRDSVTTNGVYVFNDRSRRMFESLGFAEIEKFRDDDGNECCRYRLELDRV